MAYGSWERNRRARSFIGLQHPITHTTAPHGGGREVEGKDSYKAKDRTMNFQGEALLISSYPRTTYDDFFPFHGRFFLREMKKKHSLPGRTTLPYVVLTAMSLLHRSPHETTQDKLKTSSLTISLVTDNAAIAQQ